MPKIKPNTHCQLNFLIGVIAMLATATITPTVSICQESETDKNRRSTNTVARTACEVRSRPSENGGTCLQYELSVQVFPDEKKLKGSNTIAFKVLDTHDKNAN